MPLDLSTTADRGYMRFSLIHHVKESGNNTEP